MGRFKLDEINNYGGTGGTGYFALKQNREVARVRFMYNTVDDIEGYSVHEVEIDGKKRYVNCLRSYNDPIDACPFCKAQMYAKAKLFLPIYNETAGGRVQVWERGKKFYQTLSSALARGVQSGTIVSQPFEIERQGEPRDTQTTYGIFPMGNADNTRLQDLPELPNILGSVILNKSAEDMEYYIHNGRFPVDSNSSGTYRTAEEASSVIPRRGTYRDEAPMSEPVRRTPQRREDIY